MIIIPVCITALSLEIKSVRLMCTITRHISGLFFLLMTYRVFVRRSIGHTAVQGQHRSVKALGDGRGGGRGVPVGQSHTDVHGGRHHGLDHGHGAENDPGRAQRRHAGQIVGGVQRGRAEGGPGRQRHDQPVRNGQRRGHVQPVDDAGDQRRRCRLRDGHGGRL